MKKKKVRKKRYLAMLLVFVLCVGMLDISVFAAGTEGAVETDAEQDEDAGRGRTAGTDEKAGDDQAAGGNAKAGDDQTAGGNAKAGDDQTAGTDANTGEGNRTADVLSGDGQSAKMKQKDIGVTGGDTQPGDEPEEEPEGEVLTDDMEIEELLEDGDTYTVIYKDSEEYGGEVFATHEGLKEGDPTPGYEGNWFLGKDKDFYGWSPSWAGTVEGDEHEIVYTAMYKEKDQYPITVHYCWYGTNEPAAPDKTFLVEREETYTIPLPEKLDCSFDYYLYYVDKSTENVPLGGTTNKAEAYVYYCPKVTVNHIYRLNGEEVGRVTEIAEGSLGFGEYKINGLLHNAWVTDWVTVDKNTEQPFKITVPWREKWGNYYYEYNDKESTQRLTLPANPSDVTGPFVMDLYFDRTVKAPKLTITKTADKATVKPGDTVTYAITVTNTGTESAASVKVADILPDGLTDGYWINGLGRRYSLSQYETYPVSFTLSADQAYTLKVEAKVKDGVSGIITNTASVEANGVSKKTASADITVEGTKKYPLTVYFRWAGADEEYNKAAESVTLMLAPGDSYRVPIAKAEVPFAYATNAELYPNYNAKADALTGAIPEKWWGEDIYIDYYPVVNINHIYRRDGDVVGTALWDKDMVLGYSSQAYQRKDYAFNAFNQAFYNTKFFRYPWVYWSQEDIANNNYETFTFTRQDPLVTLPGNPSELKETPVINMYYDKTTYVDITVRYIYEAEDGTEMMLQDAYEETLAKKSDYDVSEQVPATIAKDGQSYGKDSVDGELIGKALADKTITVKYVLETSSDPVPPAPPTPPSGGGGGGGGGTPDPTPTPPAPDPVTIVPVPVEPVPMAIVPDVTPVPPTPVAEDTSAAEAAVIAELTEEEVPLADNGETENGQLAEMEEEEVPLAGGEGGSWALFNFALMNLAIFESIMLLIGYFVHTKNDEKERELKKKGLFRIISLPIAVISLVVFILTENIHLQTVLVDRYTVTMLLISIIQTIVVVLSNKKYEEEQEEE